MKKFWASLLIGTSVAAMSWSALAQQVPQPAPAAPPPAANPPAAAPPAGSQQLPPVEVIQQQPKPAQPAPKQAAPAPKKKAPVAVAKQAPAPAPKKKAAAAPPPPPPPAEPVEAAPTLPQDILATSPYGAPGGAGAAQRAQTGSMTPVDAAQAIPGDLQNATSAATRVDNRELTEQRPLTNHEALARVPGIVTVSDDGFSRHSGIGIRGSAPRRSRKVLVMEDGLPLNFSTYLDASTHYTPPSERIDSIEVLRGPVVSYGPLTNHGVVNFRNLSPFGADETIIKFGIGTTAESDKEVNNFRHVHTRQNVGNVGVVASYSGADLGGAWNNEELGYNDFYGAIGFRGINQDLKISGGYFRQRDKYDEINFVPNDEDTGFAEFNANKWRKSGSPYFFDGSTFLAGLSTFNADYWRVQATHNYYFDRDTTLSSRAYFSDNERNRYFVNADRGEFDEDSFFMRGRERHYRFYGVEERLELANRPFLFGMQQDIQFGIRYERHEFRNCNAVGEENEVLSADRQGRCDIFARLPQFNGDRSRLSEMDTNAFSAFAQTAIKVSRALTVTPGVRFENYDITRNSIRPDDSTAEQEGRTTSDHSVVLPMIGVAWEVMPRTTVYGGYHQGITPHITRGPAFPLPNERGENYQVGLRSTALMGLSFDVAYFHSDISDYQIKSPAADANNRFGAADEVKIDGVEIGTRLDSRPFTGGPWNLFGEAVYTYANSRIHRGLNDDGDSVAGNLVPEVSKHYANLTLGIAHQIGWDASVTWSYRGKFFTDINNEAGLEVDDGEVESGLVPGVWLLSARSNLKINDRLTLFLTGSNLLNTFYLSDIDEGLKPGQSRSIMGGLTVKLQ